MNRAKLFLREILPLAIRRRILRAGEFFGAGMETGMVFPSMLGGLRTLRGLGLRPGSCIDIGAYHGEWAVLFREVFPESRVLMVEAQEARRPALEKVMAAQSGMIQLENALLGAEDGKAVLFNEMGTGSSVFAETSPYERNAVTKTTVRLDTLLERRGDPAPDFLKLDVQGYELEILRGAPKTLAGATAVLMEASLMPVNSGCPLIGEVMAFMSAAGFRLFDFCSQLRRKDGVLWQTDLLFLRADSPVLPKPELTRENWL